jgi:hypothetical protein
VPRLIAIVGVILFVLFAAVEAGVISSPFARVKLIATGEGVAVVKGTISSNARLLIADIFRSSGVANGFVTVSSRDKVRFSMGIPHRIRQQLRNVVLL